MLTKTQYKIMQLFAGNIEKSFSIRRVAKDLIMSYPLVHRAITDLIRSKYYLKLDENKLLRLNYQDHHDMLAYVESIRRKKLFKKRYAKPIKDFLEEILDKFDQEYFIIILFGSAVVSSKPKDYDLLFIFESNEVANKRERAIEVIGLNHSKKFHFQSIGSESVFEMASKRTQKNVFNELLNNHIILYGAENFYRLLKHARQ